MRKLRNILFSLCVIALTVFVFYKYNNVDVSAEEVSNEVVNDTNNSESNDEVNNEYTVNIHYNDKSFARMSAAWEMNLNYKEKTLNVKDGLVPSPDVVITSTDNKNVNGVKITRYATADYGTSFVNVGDSLKNIDTDNDHIVDLYPIYAVRVGMTNSKENITQCPPTIVYQETEFFKNVDGLGYAVEFASDSSKVVSATISPMPLFSIVLKYSYKEESQAYSLVNPKWLSTVSLKETSAEYVYGYNEKQKRVINPHASKIEFRASGSNISRTVNGNNANYEIVLKYTLNIRKITFKFDFGDSLIKNDFKNASIYNTTVNSKPTVKNAEKAFLNYFIQKVTNTNSFIVTLTTTDSEFRTYLESVFKDSYFEYIKIAMPEASFNNCKFLGWSVDNTKDVFKDFFFNPVYKNGDYVSGGKASTGIKNLDFAIQDYHTLKANVELPTFELKLDKPEYFKTIEAYYTEDQTPVDFNAVKFTKPFKFKYVASRGYNNILINGTTPDNKSYLVNGNETFKVTASTYKLNYKVKFPTTNPYTNKFERTLPKDEVVINQSFNIPTIKGKKFVGFKTKYSDQIIDKLIVPSEFYLDSESVLEFETCYEDIEYTLKIDSTFPDNVISAKLTSDKAKIGDTIRVDVECAKGYGYARFVLYDSNNNKVSYSFDTNKDITFNLYSSVKETELIVKIERVSKISYNISFKDSLNNYVDIKKTSFYYGENHFALNPRIGVRISNLKFENENNESLDIPYTVSTSNPNGFEFDLNNIDFNVLVSCDYELIDINVAYDLNGGTIDDTNLIKSFKFDYATQNRSEEFLNQVPTRSSFRFNGFVLLQRSKYEQLQNTTPESIYSYQKDYQMDEDNAIGVYQYSDIYSNINNIYTLINYDHILNTGEDVVVVATWMPDVYKVSVVSNSDLINYSNPSFNVYYLNTMEEVINYINESLKDLVYPNSKAELVGIYYDSLFTESVKATDTMPAKNLVLNLKFNEVKDEYVIKFVDDLGNEIKVVNVLRNEMPEDFVPTKNSDNYYEYKFKSWDKEFVPATFDTTYKAIFDSKLIDYSIVFKDYDGRIISENTYNYHDKVSIPEISREDSAKYIYTFKGWYDLNGEKASNVCLGSCEYIASYNESIRKYDITFRVNGKDTIISYEYGVLPEPNVNTDKMSDEKYNYVFKGWTPEVVEVTENTIYEAVYEKNEKIFKITFYDVNGKVIEVLTYKYGEQIKFPNANSLAIEEGKEFAGWVDEKGSDITKSLSTKTSIKALPKLIDISNTIPVIDKILGTDFKNIKLDRVLKDNSKIDYYNTYRRNSDKTISRSKDGAEFNINKPYKDKHIKYRAYMVNDDGSMKEIETKDNDDSITLVCESLGKVILVADEPISLTNVITGFGIACAVLTLCVVITSAAVSKNKNKIKEQEF